MLGKRKIICPNPNCGYKGYAKKKAKGSMIVFLFLLFLGILPGLIYYISKSGYTIFAQAVEYK
jgi:hypothetical protein